MPSAASDRLRSRYGRPASPRRGRIVVAVIALVFLALVAYVGVRAADQPMRVDTVSYRHVDAGHISVTFQVTHRPGAAARCSVEALDATRAQVGFTEVDVPAGSGTTSVRTVVIATQGDAVSASADSCRER